MVDAAVIRILNTFKQGVKVYLAFSAGKDSLCLSHMVYSLIKQGKIDPKQLTVFFIDEEAIYPSMEQMAYQWHSLFSNLGVRFDWYCLPFKQVSCFHQLQNDERWITWEPGKEDCWVRDAPPFAIRKHPAVKYPGQMNYQHFCTIVMNDGIMLMGVRASESVQRLRNIARSKMNGGATGQQFVVQPMYDWKDTDVWLYIKEHHLKFPESYMDLYRDGEYLSSEIVEHVSGEDLKFSFKFKDLDRYHIEEEDGRITAETYTYTLKEINNETGKEIGESEKFVSEVPDISGITMTEEVDFDVIVNNTWKNEFFDLSGNKSWVSQYIGEDGVKTGFSTDYLSRPTITIELYAAETDSAGNPVRNDVFIVNVLY